MALSMNPNNKIPGLIDKLPNINKNVNPGGLGGLKGASQPQPTALGALNNSTSFRPRQMERLGGDRVAFPYDRSNEPSATVSPPGLQSIYEQTLEEMRRRNQLMQEQLGMIGQGRPGEAQLLAMQEQMNRQMRDVQPRSGAFVFKGGL